MTLFLVLGMPVFLGFILTVFFSDGFDRRLVLLSVGKGMLWFFPALVLYGLATGFIENRYEGAPLYFTRTGDDLLLPLFFGMAAYLFSYRKDLIISGKEQFVRTVAFLCGFYMLFSQYTLLTFRGWYEGYVYFLLPLCWMVLAATWGLASGLFFSIIGGVRFLFLALGVGMVFLLGSVSYLYLLNLRIYAWFLAVAIFLAGLAVLRRGLETLK
jgi:hypothetical protein